MALLKNSTVGGGTSGTTSTASYAFPSGSFTHQKQPIMPSDQKAKLLAMHRDSRANAGMYVAVVLAVYLVLVIMLLCRYAKRRPSEPLPNIDSAAEQGRLRLFNFHGSKLACVGGGGCNNTIMQSCFGRCRRANTDTKIVASSQQQHTIEECNKATTRNTSNTIILNNDQLAKEKNGIMEETNNIQDQAPICPTTSLGDEVVKSNQQKQSECGTSEDEHNNEDGADISEED